MCVYIYVFNKCIITYVFIFIIEACVYIYIHTHVYYNSLGFKGMYLYSLMAYRPNKNGHALFAVGNIM